MDAIEYFKCMRKRLCEDYLKFLPQKSVGYQATLREMSFYDAAIKALEQKPCEDAISRSDAIRIVSGYCHWTNIPDELAKLPSVNPIPCEDAVSRQAVLDLLQEEREEVHITSEAITKIRIAEINVEDLKAIPPVMPAPKMGRWKKVPGMNEQCDQCGKYFPLSDFYDRPFEINYCPFCGAKMKGVEE